MAGSVHAISYALGVVLGHWHREYVAEVLPFVLEYNFEQSKHIYEELYFYLVSESDYINTPKEMRAQAFCKYVAEWFKTLSKKIGGNKTIVELGLSEQNIENVAKIAVLDGTNFTSPRYIDYDAIKNILTRILRGAQ